MRAMRLKQRVLRVNEQLTGNRLLRGMACLGGVRFDFDADQLSALARLVDEFEQEFKELVELIRSHSGTRERRDTTGALRPEVARTPASRASRAARPASTTTCVAISRTTSTTRCNAQRRFLP